MSDAAGAAARVQRLFEAKSRAELAAADTLYGAPVPVAGAGDPTAEVVLVKGDPGPDDVRAGRALAGPDGEAAAKALEALGLDPSSTWAVCSRPGKAPSPKARAKRLEMVVEAVDPRLVIALDEEAARDLAAAFGVRQLPPGTAITVRGRSMGAVGGLSASLGDEGAKAAVWKQFKRVAEPVTDARRSAPARGGRSASGRGA